MGGDIPLIILTQNTPLADSRAIAQGLRIEHDRFLDHVTAYQHEIERRCGMVRFEIAESEYYALLTEDQALIYLSYSPQVRAKTYKQILGRAFARAYDQLAPVEEDETDIITWTHFLALWHTLLGEKPLHATELEQHLRTSAPFASTLPYPLDSAFLLPQSAFFAIRLGRALGKWKNIPLGPRGWMIQQERDTHSKSFCWYVVTTK
ncbi:MAG: hypothetical protein H0V70_30460 [Ktedonobacteraceae bacterium]|jgi:hypothetical protein|nr:hypothetical protein [Ktedonobacteraceae bacterium]